MATLKFAKMLMANLRKKKMTIISDTNAEWLKRPQGPNIEAVEVVHQNCPNKRDYIVANDDVVTSLHELFSLSCEPELEEQLHAEEEVRLWGWLPPGLRSRFIVEYLGVRRRPSKDE